MANEKDKEAQQVEVERDQATEDARKAELFEELKEVLPKPHVDYVPDWR